MPDYREFSPAPALRDYVECCWTLQTDLALEREPCLPDGSASLIFIFGKPYFRSPARHPDEWQKVERWGLVHQGRQAVFIRQQSPARMLGVRFKPHGLGPLLQISMQALSPPFCILGKELESWFGDDLHEILAAEACMERRRELLEESLLAMLPGSPKPDGLVEAAVGAMVRSGGSLKIAGLLDELCVSKSTLEKRFQEHVGLSPKNLCGILRFNSIVCGHHLRPSPTLTELTYKRGFFDQAHLVHDFKAFTGQPPGRFFRQGNRLVEMLRQSFERRVGKIYGGERCEA